MTWCRAYYIWRNRSDRPRLQTKMKSYGRVEEKAQSKHISPQPHNVQTQHKYYTNYTSQNKHRHVLRTIWNSFIYYYYYISCEYRDLWYRSWKQQCALLSLMVNLSRVLCRCGKFWDASLHRLFLFLGYLWYSAVLRSAMFVWSWWCSVPKDLYPC